jgi:RNA polymerase sigma factor (sigma-70 family)
MPPTQKADSDNPSGINRRHRSHYTHVERILKSIPSRERPNMADVAAGMLQRQMESLFDGGVVAGLSDRDLLERFIAQGDASAEAAFAAMVARHGPMVWGICRQVLRDRHQAEDAFQAVFLILARKSGSIRNADLLASWLYGVTLRVARRARRKSQRRLESESAGVSGCRTAMMLVQSEVPSVEAVAISSEHAAILHDEMARLPRVFRLPVVLHYLEGLTLDEIARRLNWRPGTVRSRLARARVKLRRQLMRRGVVLADGELAVVLGLRSMSGPLPSFLYDATIKAAVRVFSGHALQTAIPASVAALTQDVIRRMLVDRLRLVLVAILLLGSAAVGLGYLAHAQGQNRAPGTTAAGEPHAAATAGAPPAPAPGRMLITGRVLDPLSRPVPNATVMAYSHLRGSQDTVAGHGQSESSGSYRLDVPATSSQRHTAAGVLAIAPGFGAGWVEFHPDDQHHVADIVLQREQVIHGRLFELQGRPAAGVTVSVSAMRRVIERNLDPQREKTEGPIFWRDESNNFPGWPSPAVTDAAGRYTVHGIGRDVRAFLTVLDSRFAPQDIELETDGKADSKPLTLALQPAQFVSGRITYADTGKPMRDAWVNVRSLKEGITRAGRMYGSKTDTNGRYRVNTEPGETIDVYGVPPTGQPYLERSKRLPRPKGAVDYSVDLALPRGVLIRGKVSEQSSGKPIAGAIVTLNSHPKPPIEEMSSTDARSAEDGTFQLRAVPSPGYFAVQGPSTDYILQAMSYHQYFSGLPGGARIYAHAFLACDPKPATSELEVNFTLRTGVTIHGAVIGPDAQAVPETWLISRVVLGPLGGVREGWRANQHGLARNGRFEIHGLDPEIEVPVYFLEPNRKLGATAYFSGKSPRGGPVTVRLLPCGTAKARLVDLSGKPIAGFSAPWMTSMVVTPGPYPTNKARKDGVLLADQGRLPAVDPINYRKDPVSDAQGRITFPALIPGATYRIVDRTPFRGVEGPQVRKEFSVRPAENLELGDILIEKPEMRSGQN